MLDAVPIDQAVEGANDHALPPEIVLVPGIYVVTGSLIDNPKSDMVVLLLLFVIFCYLFSSVIHLQLLLISQFVQELLYFGIEVHIQADFGTAELVANRAVL